MAEPGGVEEGLRPPLEAVKAEAIADLEATRREYQVPEVFKGAVPESVRELSDEAPLESAVSRIEFVQGVIDRSTALQEFVMRTGAEVRFLHSKLAVFDLGWFSIVPSSYKDLLDYGEMLHRGGINIGFLYFKGPGESEGLPVTPRSLQDAWDKGEGASRRVIKALAKLSEEEVLNRILSGVRRTKAKTIGTGPVREI